MLGLHTSPYYPYVTARECSASAILGEAGFSPFDVREIYGVFRTYPIRVGGNSGDTGGDELTWEEISRRSEKEVEPERTTVTRKIRRVFEFSYEDMRHSIRINKPSILALTFLDYIDVKDSDKLDFDGLTIRSKAYIGHLEHSLGSEIRWISTGQAPQSVIWR
jgi:adenylosuccinate synthase